MSEVSVAPPQPIIKEPPPGFADMTDQIKAASNGSQAHESTPAVNTAPENPFIPQTNFAALDEKPGVLPATETRSRFKLPSIRLPFIKRGGDGSNTADSSPAASAVKREVPPPYATNVQSGADAFGGLEPKGAEMARNLLKNVTGEAGSITVPEEAVNPANPFSEPGGSSSPEPSEAVAPANWVDSLPRVSKTDSSEEIIPARAAPSGPAIDKAGYTLEDAMKKGSPYEGATIKTKSQPDESVRSVTDKAGTHPDDALSPLLAIIDTKGSSDPITPRPSATELSAQVQQAMETAEDVRRVQEAARIDQSFDNLSDLNAEEAARADPFPDFWVEKVAPERLDGAKKLWSRLSKSKVGIIGANWAKNLDPRGKDTAWKIGAAIGAAESVAIGWIPMPPPLNGFVKAGANLLAAQGLYAAASRIHERATTMAKAQVAASTESAEEDFGYIVNKNVVRMLASSSGEVKRAGEKQEEVEDKYANAKQKIRNTLLGVSAGATYLSVTGAISSAVGVDYEAMLDTVSDKFTGTGGVEATAAAVPSAGIATTPEVHGSSDVPPSADTPISATDVGADHGISTGAPGVPEAVAPAPAGPSEATQAVGVNESGGGEIVKPAAIPSENAQVIGVNETTTVVGSTAASETISSATKELIDKAIAANPDIAKIPAGLVFDHLEQANTAAREAINAAGIDTSQLSAQAYDKIRAAAQYALEDQANTSLSTAAEQLANAPADPSQAIEATRNAFEQTLANPEAHKQLVDAAKIVIDQQQAAHDQLLQTITQEIAKPDVITEVVVNRGATAGQILIDHGYDVTWGAADSDFLAAHIAANYDSLNDVWGNIAAAGNLPEGFHFPADLGELSIIAEKAKAGDPQALQQLKDALHWLPVNQKFKIVNKSALEAVLATIKR